jgi:uncharacterized protein YdaU (DUF1376 family)
LNFYDFHIGDYARRTGHLEPMEDLAYRRMLDLYYTRECALPADVAEICRLIRMRGHAVEVEAVLREFFVPEEHGDWVHMHCEEIIAAAVVKRTKARESAAKRWDSERKANAKPTQKKRTAKAKPTHTEGNAPSPIPSPIPKDTPLPPDGGFGWFYEKYPKKVAPDKALKAFEKVSPDAVTLRQMLDAIDAQMQTEAWRKDGGQFIPYPATWLNGGHWKNAMPPPPKPADIFTPPPPLTAEERAAADAVRLQVMSAVKRVA